MNDDCLGIGFFRIARDEALKSSHKIKVGAVLSDKRPISRGYNKLKTHPRIANPALHKKLSIHAEIACILSARAEARGDTIYVYREDRFGVPALARPCADCMKSLREYGIREVFYSIPHAPYWARERVS